MTLHWWMHWFWVTAQIAVSLTTSCLGATSGIAVASSPAQATRTQYETTEALARLQQSYRIAKAVGIQPTTPTTPTATDDSSAGSAGSLGQSVASDSPPPPPPPPHEDRPRSSAAPAPASDDKPSTQPGRIPGKKESKLAWIHAFSKPPRLKTSSPEPPTADEELLTVMPLREREDLRGPATGASSQQALLDPNAIRREQLQLPMPAANRSGEVATAASIVEAGLGDSTRLGRARGTFTSEFQRDQLAREERNKEEAMKETATGSGAASVTEIATITGSCLAIIILLSTLGSLGFIVYRRRYLNPPQTLNSDKCSNPDSSGYIDDSTIRDNSEEMYSLDNDSFLNSLEAMTIQNYWTDSVKHTKL